MKSRTMKRWISLALCFAMILSFIPGISPFVQAAVDLTGGKVADGSTMSSWESLFDPDNISTEHAGGIWTDKSVFVDQNGFVNLKDGEGNTITLSTADDSFLVALSALAANSIVVGQGAVPTDTVIVLDVSNSMTTTDITNMVTATNNAIRSLMSGNETNRVGVVMYGTTASVLMPLNRYTGVEVDGVEQFIRYSGGNQGGGPGGQGGSNSITTAIQYTVVTEGDSGNGNGRPNRPGQDNTQTVTDYPTYVNAQGQTVDIVSSVAVGGGTYIQGGLWEAYEQLNAASVTDTRAPVIVLMSDGAPTYTTDQYNDVPDSATHGGGSYSTTGDGFVTQLTAAYIKAQLKNKYGSAYMYTLGLGVEDIDIAQAVLDPKNNQTADIAAEWADYLAGSAEIYLPPRGNSSSNVTITKAASVTFSAYADRYFTASQSSSLVDVFKDIVNEISLRAGYYPTRLDDNGSNYSGYVTFVDEIGRGMEVRDMIGIKIGDVIYTGQLLVDYMDAGTFGTKEEPTDLGNNLVWAVKARFGLEDTQEVWNLLDYSYGKTLGYMADGSWNNCITWYGDAEGNYLGYDPANLTGDAVYYNECYGMLGTTGTASTAADMMYITIQVSTKLSDGSQIVTFRIPASLLPTVTYEIYLDSDTVETSTSFQVNYNAAEPISLIYEVGVREDVNALNIGNYATYDFATGKYYLYTNAWDGEINSVVSGNSHTYSYFEPSSENEHYYFTEDSVVYVATGTDTYEPATQITSGQTYYARHRTFVVTNAQTGAAQIVYQYDAMSSENYGLIQKDEATGNYYMPKGTPHKCIHSHDVSKADNATGTEEHVSYHIADAFTVDGATHVNELTYLGNNGRLEVQMPQGIAISKELAEGTTVPDGTKFTFEVEFNSTVASQYETVTVAADGSQTEGVAEVTSGKLTVQLEANETVYILGLPTDTSYTVTEKVPDGYLLDRVVGSQTGTVEAQTINEIIFINGLRTYSDLAITKQVTYNNGTAYDAANDDYFEIIVELKDGNAPWANKNVVVQENGQNYGASSDAEGKVIISLQDRQTITLKDLPVGVTYTITENEQALGKGFAFEGGTGLTGTIQEENQSALVINSYTPDKVVVDDEEPAITVNLDKILKDVNGNEIEDWTSGTPAYSFQFMLERWNGTTWTQQGSTLTMTQPDTASFSLAGVEFTTAGDHYFRVSEIVGERGGMTYDRTLHIFKVVVTDTDWDGLLEISDVQSVDHAEVTQTTDRKIWTVDTSFTNTYIANSAKLTFHATKELDGRNLAAGEFRFALYATGSDGMPLGEAKEIVTNGAAGDIYFTSLTYTAAGEYHYLIKELDDGKDGIGYDTNEYYITVWVADNNGQLYIENVDVNKNGNSGGFVTVTDGVVEVATFKNTFTPDPVTVTLTAGKTLTGKDLESNMFRFRLYDSAGNPVGEPVYNVGSTITLPQLTFTEEGTFTYTISEINDGKGGFTYDAANLTVTIVVTKDQTTGALSAAVGQLDVTNGTYNVGTFHNSYAAAEVKVTFTGHKNLANKTLEDEMFSFLLTDEAGKPLETVKNVSGKYTFTELTFTETGDYTYYVSEIKGGLGGITYDDTVYRVTVSVTDNDGKLEASVQVGNAQAQKIVGSGSADVGAFNNSYSANKVSAAITGTKVLEGKRLLADQFSFQLQDSGGNALQTVRNGIAPDMGDVADGGSVVVHDSDILFKPIEYTTTGTHTYKIVEIDEGKGGISYDKTVYTATVTITDDGEGQLQAKITYSGEGSLIFKNSYSAAAVKVTFHAGKTLNGAAPGDEKFSFVMKDGDNRQVGEAVTNDADGKIAFPALTFDAEGTYTYKISEVNGGKKGYTYDTTVYTVTITVTDDGSGQLKAAAKVGNTDANIDEEGVLNVGTFHNTYTDNENPKTADDSKLMLWGMGMILSTLAVLVLCAAPKKKEQEA